ncbi:MAG: ABC transporter ATP-binding protein, partial [Gammaproteobacteria bacterium]
MSDRREILLETRGLARAFGEGARRRAVLEHVDLCIHRGEHVALLGRSGSGKSTLLNLIAGIDQADLGSIQMDGADLARLREPARTLFRRARIGFVHQFFNLIPTLSVFDNIALPLQLLRKSESEIARRVTEMLDAVGLRARGRDYPDQLSGGEQQRIAIARALAHQPQLVLADEPTGNLDAESGRRALALLAARDAAALLTVTHSREVARAA